MPEQSVDVEGIGWFHSPWEVDLEHNLGIKRHAVVKSTCRTPRLLAHFERHKAQLSVSNECSQEPVHDSNCIHILTSVRKKESAQFIELLDSLVVFFVFRQVLCK